MVKVDAVTGRKIGKRISANDRAAFLFGEPVEVHHLTVSDIDSPVPSIQPRNAIETPTNDRPGGIALRVRMCVLHAIYTAF